MRAWGRPWCSKLGDATIGPGPVGSPWLKGLGVLVGKAPIKTIPWSARWWNIVRLPKSILQEHGRRGKLVPTFARVSSGGTAVNFVCGGGRNRSDSEFD